MSKKTLFHTFIVAALVSLGLFTTSAGAAHAQDYDDDGNRILTPTEVLTAVHRIERIQGTMRTYATVGVDAEALVNAPNAFDITPGRRPDIVEIIKASSVSNPSNTIYDMLRIREGDFQTVEMWHITNVKGKDGKIHRLAKLDLEQSLFNQISFREFMQQKMGEFEAEYRNGRTPQVTEADAFTDGSNYYVNDVTKIDPSRAEVAFVVAKGITSDDQDTPTQRNIVSSYYGRTCQNSAVTGSSFAPSSDFAAKARSYSFSCKDGLVQGAPDGSLRVWFPGDEKPAAPAKPTRP